LKLSRNSFLAEVGHRSSHRLSKHFPEISLDRFIVASSTQGPGSIPWPNAFIAQLGRVMPLQVNVKAEAPKRVVYPSLDDTRAAPRLTAL